MGHFAIENCELIERLGRRFLRRRTAHLRPCWKARLEPLAIDILWKIVYIQKAMDIDILFNIFMAIYVFNCIYV